MNLFCFTLEGSTESVYEPPYSQTVREAGPKFQCSPTLRRRRPGWGGSDSSINCSKSQSAKTNRNNVRSCFVTSDMDNELKDIHRACWISSADTKDPAHQKRVPDKDMCRTSEDIANRLVLNHEKIKTDPTLQASKTAADTAESIKARRLKKLQNRLPSTKGGQQSASVKEGSVSEDCDKLTDVLSIYNPVLSCMGLGKREKKPSLSSPSAHSDCHSHEHSEVDQVWSPVQSPCELCRPQHQSCHEPGHASRHELWEGGSGLSLPRAAAWDRFESLIQELDSKEPEPCLPHMVRSITDLDLHQDQWSDIADLRFSCVANIRPKEKHVSKTCQWNRFGRFDAFRQQWPLTTEQDNGWGCTTHPDGELNIACRKKEAEVESQKDRKPVKTGDAINVNQNLHGEPTKAHRNSLESLCSSGQSSSSGVTSGSNCSSNRTSLRLDEELSSPRTFCGRARVHTDFEPSPYDTDSLKLKVGDVINIISKPAMGTWTGRINNKIGFFKFIYVDLLKEEAKTGDTSFHELLERFDLEEYALRLKSHGYETAADLVKLREHHLTELEVTDPEHRRRLLLAVSSLRPLRSESEEAVYENIKSCPRDSGCGLVCPDSMELHSPCEQTDEISLL